MSKIFALDQSSRITGYSFFIDGKLAAYGKWEHTHQDIFVRIHRLCQEIRGKIEEYEPDIVLIENIQMERGEVSTFQKLAWVQGAIIQLCIEMNTKYELIAPSTWRSKCKFLKGQDKRRAAQKKIAQSWVLDTFGMKCTQDEADAICIGYSYTLDEELRWD